ncbi:MAG TPA: biotin/lipoyl attachment [Firmicutes bacterium]|nr:biotin/lipoyl attachment [Bacillota bacterium]
MLRAPAAGVFRAQRSIGDLVQAGETVAFVDGVPVVAAIDGMVRGMLFNGLPVEQGMKVGDLDPRGREANCHTISDKARSVSGGVLEAIMHLWFKQGKALH